MTEIKSIIEEAAGIKKLQANRIEAQKNLANIEINLDKVEFILNETRENKNKIEKQAELAQKYIDLRDSSSTGKNPQVAPYSGALLAIFALALLLRGKRKEK